MTSSKSEASTPPHSDPDNQVHTLFKQWDLYSRIIAANWMRHREIIEQLQIILADVHSPLNVLDLGCGDGYLAFHGLAKLPMNSFTGVDLSDDALKRLTCRGPFGNQNHSVSPQTICGDILSTCLKLDAASFDVTLASYAIHHFETADKSQILNHIYRTLRPQGLFVWVDIARQPEETRQQFIDRLTTWIVSDWECLTLTERNDSANHISESDYPESEQTMLQLARDAGLIPLTQLLKDDFYVSWVFQRIER
jgi:ubiquinone/menaquinone biosynthesis C-methylase UbiE